jgi:hypothetical protein
MLTVLGSDNYIESSIDDSGDAFFTSPQWYVPYIRAWPRKGTRIVALNETDANEGFVALSSVQRLSRLKRRYVALGVNVCLAAKFADVTLEANGAFSRSSLLSENWISPLLKLIDQEPKWDELVVPSLNKYDFELAKKISELYGWKIEEVRTKPSFSAVFEKGTQSASEKVLGLMSANSRSQIRRAIRQVNSQLGELQIRTAGTVSEVESWLSALAQWHFVRWGQNSDAGGFSNPLFFQFQKALAIESLNAGSLRLHQISAGDTPLGYLMNFHWQGAELFYVGAFNYGKAQALKPGLLSHYLAMCSALQEGCEKYDFLAGSHRYKESMSNESTSRFDLIFRRNRSHFHVEAKLKETLVRLKNFA